MTDTDDLATDDDIPPWHPYDGCYGCRAGYALARKAEKRRDTTQGQAAYRQAITEGVQRCP